jgi:FkbM family methyltransferase
MAVYANDFIGISINNDGFYEKEHLDVLFEFLRNFEDNFRESVAFDIGANIGNHSVYFSRKFAQVVAFEPNPSTFKLLEFNSSWAYNIMPINLGLGETPGAFKMREQMGNFGASAVVEDSELGSAGDLIDIRISTLDQYLDNFKDVAFLKIDVEGHEYAVLKGGMEFISKNRPVIVFEQHLSDFVDGRSKAVSLLQQNEYKIFWHQSGVKSPYRLVRLASNIMELLAGRKHKILTDHIVPAQFHHMLIAVPDGKLKKLENDEK